MRSIGTTKATILLVVVAASGLWRVRQASAQQSPNSTQIVFSVTSATFNYTTTPPSFNGDPHFGFWIWCSGPSGTTPYQGTCDGSMYFYGISPATQPVQGTAKEVGTGAYQMSVWSPNNAYVCQLTNVPPTVPGPNNTVKALCTSPEGSATVPNAVVHVSK